MANQCMSFLNARRIFGRNSQTVVSHLGQFSPATAGHTRGDHSDLFRGPDRVDYVRRFTRRGNSNRHVSSSTKRFDLSSKNPFVRIIITNRRQTGTVCCQRQRWQSSPLAHEPAYQLCGHVLCVSSTSAIPEEN